MEAVYSAAGGGWEGFGTVGSIFLEASMNVATSASVTLDLRYRKFDKMTLRIVYGHKPLGIP